MITVKQLIELLQQEDPNRFVIMAKDRFGNGGYFPFENISNLAYSDNKVGMDKIELTEEDKQLGYSEEDLLPNGLPAIVLFPEHNYPLE